MTFSIIVVLSQGVERRRRREVFEEVLKSFLRLNYPKDLFEIVLVDSDSGLSLSDLEAIKRSADSTGVLLTFFDPRQGNLGPARARNFGANQISHGQTRIKSDFLVFTDDDTIVPQNWLKVLFRVFEDYPESGGAGGVCLPPLPFSRTNLFARHDEFIYGQYFPNGQRDLELLRGGQLKSYISRKVLEHPVFSGSICYRREVFEKVEGFNESYDPGVYGEDASLKEKVLAGGGFLVFAPVISDHLAVYNLNRFRLQQEGRGRGIMKFRLDHRLSEQSVREIYARLLFSPFTLPFYLLAYHFDLPLAFLQVLGYFFRQWGKIKYLNKLKVSARGGSVSGGESPTLKAEEGKKVKILFADHTPLVGGAQLALYRHLKYLDRERFEPLIVVETQGPLVEKFKAIAGVTVAEVSFPQLKTINPLVFWSLLIGVFKISRVAFSFRPQLMVANTERAFYLLFLVSLITHQKLILIIRDFDFSKLLLRLTSFRIEHYFCVSKKVRDFYGLATSRASVCYVGSDFGERLSAVTPEAVKDLRAMVGAPGNGFVIGFVGRLVEWKGPRILLEAFREVLRQGTESLLYLVFVGEGPIRVELENLAIKYGIDSRVFWAGHAEDVENWYRVFDIFVHASVAPEPFATTVVEAALTGLPIVATRTGGTGEFVRDGENGLLVDPDPGAVAESILRLLSDRDFGRQLGQAACHEARTKFTENQVTAGMEEIYLSL